MTCIEHQPGMLWTAAHAKPRCEKVVTDYCERHDLPCYLPLRRRAKRYQRRLVETFLPMFPGYIFVQLDDARKTRLLQSHKVVHVLPIDDICEKVLIEELQELKRLEELAKEQEVVVRPELVVGRPVLICAGPFEGVTGIVERRQREARVSINVELLGQSASVVLDVGDVDVAED